MDTHLFLRFGHHLPLRDQLLVGVDYGGVYETARGPPGSGEHCERPSLHARLAFVHESPALLGVLVLVLECVACFYGIFNLGRVVALDPRLVSSTVGDFVLCGGFRETLER